MRRLSRPWQTRIAVTGVNLSRFIRLAGEKNIPLTALRRPSAKRFVALCREDDLPHLQALAESGGWTLSVGERTGLGRMADGLRARWLMWAGVAVAVLLMTLASRVVWRIEVEGAGPYDADVRAALNEMNVSAPMPRAAIDLGALRDALEWRYPRVAWVECGFRGVTLTVRLVEGVLPVAEGESGPCDLVASRDGVVHHIVTRAGTPVVEVGDIVRAGDVLIRGEERTADGEVRPVAARGSVMARVWMAAAVTMPLTETQTVPTGETSAVWTVRTPFFDLWEMPDCPYAHYDTAVRETPLIGLFLPVTLHEETRIAVEYEQTPRPLADVQQEALAAARRKLHEKCPPKESFIDIWGNCSMIDAENVSAVATGEVLEDIAVRSD